MATRKVGRNEDCPCGSGTKYKKCCLPTDEARGEVARIDESPPLHTAYDDRWSFVDDLDEDRAAEFATTSTPDIVAFVRDWTETEPTAERLRTDSETATSAAELARRWCHLDALPPEAKHAGLVDAMTELWSRWCPERPCDERIRQWIEGGYEDYGEFLFVEACTEWFRAWDAIHSRLGNASTCEEAEARFSDAVPLMAWLPDVLPCAERVAPMDPSWAARALALCKVVLAQFVDEDAEWRHQFETGRGELLFAVGRRAEGEAHLRRLVAEDPTAMAYLALAEALHGSGATKEALSVVEEALRIPVDEADLYDLAGFADELREELSDNGSGSAIAARSTGS